MWYFIEQPDLTVKGIELDTENKIMTEKQIIELIKEIEEKGETYPNFNSIIPTKGYLLSTVLMKSNGNYFYPI